MIFLTNKQFDKHNDELTKAWQTSHQRQKGIILDLQAEIKQLKNPVPAERLQFMYCKAVSLHQARVKTRKFLRKVYGSGWAIQETEVQAGDVAYTNSLPQERLPGLKLEADRPGALIMFVITYRVTKKERKAAPERDDLVWASPCDNCGTLQRPGDLYIWCSRGFCNEDCRTNWAVNNRRYS